jgi:hypothetical protein
MAVTVTPTIVDRATMLGAKRVVIADLALSGAYVANGVPVTAAMFGLVSLDTVFVANPNINGLLAGYVDGATKYIKFYNSTATHTHTMGLTRVADGTGLQAVYFNKATGQLSYADSSGATTQTVASSGTTATVGSEFTGSMPASTTVRVMALGV